MTVPVIDGVNQPVRRGCKVVSSNLNNRKNPAQDYGSALTYARRYSLLMAFGLATEDDDGKACENREGKWPKSNEPQQYIDDDFDLPT